MMYYYKVNNDKCNRLVIRDKEILTINEPGWYITDVSYEIDEDIDKMIITIHKFESDICFGPIHTAAGRPRKNKSRSSRTDKNDRAHSTNKRKRKEKTNG